MIFAECYYVTYYVADFTKNGETTGHEDIYQSYDNALLMAKELIKCRDISGSVRVTDGSTGEILDEFYSEEEWHRNDNNSKKMTMPKDPNSFEDELGCIWRRDEDEPELWSVDCEGLPCDNCPYNFGTCERCYTDRLRVEDVYAIIAEAKERMGK